MRDVTPRRFTVGLGEGRTVRINAADEMTKAWADHHAPVMAVALRTIAQDVESNVMASEPNLGVLGSRPVETPKSLAERWTEIMRRGFPEERFDVRANEH